MSAAWELATDVFGKRYGEVLLVRLGAAGPEATVYKTASRSTPARRSCGPGSTPTPSPETTTFGAGRPVFELVDPDGRRWVMYTWSQIVDPALSLDDLANSHSLQTC